MRGAREFLRTSRSILARPRTALWITPQGRFADARERPPGVQPGVAHLAHRLKQAVILPLALEYPFWEERRPEALARFGQAIVVERGTDRTVEGWRTCIEAALTRTQDALDCEARYRDPAAFETLVGGKAGVGGVLDGARWLRARFPGGVSAPSLVPGKCSVYHEAHHDYDRSDCGRPRPRRDPCAPVSRQPACVSSAACGIESGQRWNQSRRFRC